MRRRRNCLSNPLIILHTNFLGDAGQVIPMIQVASDSWLLVGYRYDEHDAPYLHPSSSSTRRSDDGNCDTRSPHSNVFNHDTVHPDNEEDEKDEGRDENASESNPDVTGGHKRPDRGDMHLRLRTRQRWSKSDEQRVQEQIGHEVGRHISLLLRSHIGRSAGALVHAAET